jgi:hypothetical protein
MELSSEIRCENWIALEIMFEREKGESLSSNDALKPSRQIG